jgi:hypothetical protein
MAHEAASSERRTLADPSVTEAGRAQRMVAQQLKLVIRFPITEPMGTEQAWLGASGRRETKTNDARQPARVEALWCRAPQQGPGMEPGVVGPRAEIRSTTKPLQNSLPDSDKQQVSSE